MNLSAQDRQVLRDLAEQVVSIVETERQNDLKKEWLRHNRLKPGRPMVLAFPEGSWRELIPANVLKTTSTIAQQWEYRLRQIIYTGDTIKDDQIFEPLFSINWVHEPINWGVSETKIQQGELGAYTWESPIKSLEDIEKLRCPQLKVDRDETFRHQALASDIFGDLLPVKIRGRFWWSLGMMTHAIMLRGLEQLMMDMYDNPDWLHQLMTILRDGTLSWLDELEQGGYLALNNRADYVGSGGFGYTDELPAEGFDATQVRLRDMWGFAEAQELVGVSPQMFVEFALNYQIPILERFGLNCYGCCEPVHDKMEAIKSIPNLRRVSISPWADVEKSADGLQDNYIFSYKPNPSVLAGSKVDQKAIKNGLVEFLERTRGCVVEIIMKDTHTVNNEPKRISQWVELARQAIDEVYR